MCDVRWVWSCVQGEVGVVMCVGEVGVLMCVG